MCVANPKLSYIAVEPHDLYVSFLKNNIQYLDGLYENIVVKNTMIGQQEAGTLVDHNGTATRANSNSENDPPIKQQKLDDLIAECESAVSKSQIKFIKVDVDGYDWDVIRSGESYLSKHKPLVYFECHHETQEQFDEYKKIFIRMKEWGYTHFFVFDNFGNFIQIETDINHIYQLMHYVMNQNRGLASRTIYYLDILASSEDELGFCKQVVDDYVLRNKHRPA